MRFRKHLVKITILLGALLALSACDVLSPNDPLSIKASGVVEIMEISISAEIGGRVSEVYVEEGAVVEIGDALFSIDDEELQLQREQIIDNIKVSLQPCAMSASGRGGSWPVFR